MLYWVVLGHCLAGPLVLGVGSVVFVYWAGWSLSAGLSGPLVLAQLFFNVGQGGP